MIQNQQLNEVNEAGNSKNYLIILPFKLNETGLLDKIFLLEKKIIKEELNFNSDDKDMLSKTIACCVKNEIKVEKENYSYLGECFSDNIEYDIYSVNVQDSKMELSGLSPTIPSLDVLTKDPLLSVVFLRLFEKLYKTLSFNRLKQVVK